MDMREREFLTVTRIYTVDKYVNTERNPQILHYNDYFPTHELVFFLSGENEVLVDQIRMHDRPGFLRYMPKGQSRSAYTVHALSPSVCIDIFFDATDPLGEHAFGLPDLGALRDRFEKLYEVWRKKQPGYYAQSMMILYDILYTVQKQEGRYLPSARRTGVQEAYAYLLEHYKERDLSYAALYDLAGLRHTQFAEIFRRTYACTPVQLVTRLRIACAKELLMTAHYTIAEVAALCGFENPYYFSTVFKKVTGMPPSRYTVE